MIHYPGRLNGGPAEDVYCLVEPAARPARYIITRVERDLPDGEYKLSIRGETLPVRHANGTWTFI